MSDIKINRNMSNQTTKQRKRRTRQEIVDNKLLTAKNKTDYYMRRLKTERSILKWLKANNISSNEAITSWIDVQMEMQEDMMISTESNLVYWRRERMEINEINEKIKNKKNKKIKK